VAFCFGGAQRSARTQPTSQHASHKALTNVSAALFEGKEPVWDSETSPPCPRFFLLPVGSKTELGHQPQQAQTPQSWLDIDLHVLLSVFVFALITCNRSRRFLDLGKLPPLLFYCLQCFSM
jgi:hypothetical protein